ncbi:MAG TPA: methylmalonyl-CoA epimerase [Actinomycetota bacterium]|nr:methylmalonyl-CoA epimerase [Actinomycetota bacterium]
MFSRVDHVGIAVRDLNAAIAFYEKTFGASFTYRHTAQDQGVEEAMAQVGESWIQLLQPLAPDTPVGKFIENRGEGVHHIGYGVVDVKAALEELKGYDIRLIDEHPRPGSRGASIAFIHPKSVGGVLVELVQE